MSYKVVVEKGGRRVGSVGGYSSLAAAKADATALAIQSGGIAKVYPETKSRKKRKNPTPKGWYHVTLPGNPHESFRREYSNLAVGEVVREWNTVSAQWLWLVTVRPWRGSVVAGGDYKSPKFAKGVADDIAAKLKDQPGTPPPKKNPSLGDYMSAGARHVARGASAVAKHAQTAIESAQRAAEAEAGRYREPTPAEALAVLSRAVGVKSNPGTRYLLVERGPSGAIVDSYPISAAEAATARHVTQYREGGVDHVMVESPALLAKQHTQTAAAKAARRAARVKANPSEGVIVARRPGGMVDIRRPDGVIVRRKASEVR